MLVQAGTSRVMAVGATGLFHDGRSMTRIAAALMVIMTGIGAAAAQETQIAAVVNEDMISLGDLEARIRLVLLSSQLPDNEQVRQRVAP